MTSTTHWHNQWTILMFTKQEITTNNSTLIFQVKPCNNDRFSVVVLHLPTITTKISSLKHNTEGSNPADDAHCTETFWSDDENNKYGMAIDQTADMKKKKTCLSGVKQQNTMQTNPALQK